MKRVGDFFVKISGVNITVFSFLTLGWSTGRA